LSGKNSSPTIPRTNDWILSSVTCKLSSSMLLYAM
jgi:hypothetical protein